MCTCFDDTVGIAPGHYAPQHRPLAVIETLAQTHGFGHWCWCSQVYTWQCGVVVIDASITDAELAGMHSLEPVLGVLKEEQKIDALHHAPKRLYA